MSHLFDTLEWASGSFSPHLEGTLWGRAEKWSDLDSIPDWLCEVGLVPTLSGPSGNPQNFGICGGPISLGSLLPLAPQAYFQALPSGVPDLGTRTDLP